MIIIKNFTKIMPPEYRLLVLIISNKWLFLWPKIAEGTGWFNADYALFNAGFAWFHIFLLIKLDSLLFDIKYRITCFCEKNSNRKYRAEPTVN